LIAVVGWIAKLARIVDINDQVVACRRIVQSETNWTIVRGSNLEEGESQGLPVWSRHVQDAVLKSNITRRVDFALFMVDALTNDDLIREAPAIVGCATPSALAHAPDHGLKG
jgi:hypothetical protein